MLITNRCRSIENRSREKYNRRLDESYDLHGWAADFIPPAEPYPSNLNRVKRVNLAFISLLLD